MYHKGDFNIDMAVEIFYLKKLSRVLIELGMKQHIKDPTWVTETSQTIIDLVFANIEIETSVQYIPIITDHAWVRIKRIKWENQTKGLKEYISRDLKCFWIKEFEMEWKNISQNTDETRTNFSTDEKADQFVNNIIRFLDMIDRRRRLEYRINGRVKNGTRMKLKR